jgi:hypothetical protein
MYCSRERLRFCKPALLKSRARRLIKMQLVNNLDSSGLLTRCRLQGLDLGYDLRTLAFQRSEPRHEFGNSDVRSHHRRVWRVPVVLRQQLNKFYRSRRCVNVDTTVSAWAVTISGMTRDEMLWAPSFAEKATGKSRSEKRPTLNVQSPRNSLSQWPTRAIAGANRRKRRHNSAVDILLCNIRDLLAEREGFEPPIGLHLCRISSAVHSTTLPPLQAP